MGTLDDGYHIIPICRHYSDPLLPEVPGMSEFEGKIMHSHDYREAQPFQGKTVLALGAGHSGIDIAIELAPFADKV